MPSDRPPKPPRPPLTTIGASLTVPEYQRLHKLAAERRVTLTKLVLDALRKTYPDDATK
jgi:hypothetical protein